jgi:putative PIN family toxin of toxin-antitoxin system
VPTSNLRIVLDTNIVLRGLVNIHSPSGRIIGAMERRLAILLLSKPLLSEYRAVLTDPVIVTRFPELTEEKVEVALRRFRYVGEYVRVIKARFEYPRDPLDEKLIELAIAARATDLVSADNDLLSLGSGRSDAARRLRQRLPQLRISNAQQFLQRHAREIGAD